MGTQENDPSSRVIPLDVLPGAPPDLDLPSTMDDQGRRRWIAPVLSPGPWWRRRIVLAWFLIALYTITPFLSFHGLPLVLFDIAGQRLVFFGTVLRPTDTALLALLTLTAFIGVFLLTAVLGRVWCGWACPQTVYLEFVYRPLERLMLGHPGSATRRKASGVRLVLLGLGFVLVSAHLANTFVAWFVGASPLTEWIFQSPTHHPVAFSTFALITGGMLFNFGYFREQMCSMVCPYGRFQSVLLDRRSLIVGYDALRGEPRGRRGTTTGDCVDCRMCVHTCPAGIDIRRGLQLECVQCTQCIDACDAVMTRLGRAPGLIRYGSQDSLERTPRRGRRLRLAIYPTLLGLLGSAFVVLLAQRTPIAITQLRVQQERIAVHGDEVRTPIRLRIDNRTAAALSLELTAIPPGRLVAPVQVQVAANDSADTELVVASARSDFVGGRRRVQVLAAGDGLDQTAPLTVLGPLTLNALDGPPASPSAVPEASAVPSAVPSVAPVGGAP